MRKLTLILIAILLVPINIFAANKNVGTSGAQFLKIGAGARPTAMGDAFVGIADDLNAVYHNPAGLGYLNSIHAMAMHTQWFQDMNYDFGAFAVPTKYGSIGISAATLKVDELQKRGNDETLLGNFDVSDSAYGLSYSKMLHPKFSVGGTARLIEQELDNASASTWSGDLGILYKFSEYPLSLGLAAKHFGQEVKFRNESDPLPFTVDAGLGVNFFNDLLLVGLDVRSPRDNDLQFGLGGDLRVPITQGTKINARAGYNSSITDADGASGLTLGGGLTFRQFGFDFAWVPFGDLGNTFRYSANVRF